MTTSKQLDIYQLIPRSSHLPSTPIELSVEQEAVLVKDVERALAYVPNIDLVLKKSYLELAKEDSELTGFIPFNKLADIFAKYEVSIIV